jgi:hypothetical protein
MEGKYLLTLLTCEPHKRPVFNLNSLSNIIWLSQSCYQRFGYYYLLIFVIKIVDKASSSFNFKSAVVKAGIYKDQTVFNLTTGARLSTMKPSWEDALRHKYNTAGNLTDSEWKWKWKWIALNLSVRLS